MELWGPNGATPISGPTLCGSYRFVRTSRGTIETPIEKGDDTTPNKCKNVKIDSTLASQTPVKKVFSTLILLFNQSLNNNSRKISKTLHT